MDVNTGVATSGLPPVLMVHGWAGSFARTWQMSGVETLLQETGRNVVGIDLLGHGTAEKPHDASAYSDLSLPIRQSAKDMQVDAVGFSLGAIALLHAATIKPNMFRKLILLGVGDKIFEPHDPKESELIISGIDGTAEIENTLARQFGNYARHSDNDPLALKAVLKRSRGAVFNKANASAITAEVLVIVGDRDFVLPADQLAQSFKKATFKLLKNCDHFASTDNFSFIDAMLDFFKD